MGAVPCSVKEVYKLIDHIDEDDVVILTSVNIKNYLHFMPEKIKKRQAEELIEKAKSITYQDNDFFGTFSLYGVKGIDIVSNILFPQIK